MLLIDVEDGFKATIDQFYAEYRGAKPDATIELHFMGGLLQAALHILPNDRYYALKQYIYDKHGYDPGGCSDGQLCMTDYRWEDK